MRTFITHIAIAGKLLLLGLLLCLPLAASAVDTFYINTQSDFDKLAKNYNGKEVNVKLNCDLEFNQLGAAMKDFQGTFDGQGHKFKIAFKDMKQSGYDSAPFYKVSGTIKNIHFTGSIQFRYGFSSYTESAPLARTTGKKLTVENCTSDVEFIEMSTAAYGWNRCYIAGYISEASSDAKITFKDCSAVLKFRRDYRKKNDWHDTGGFVGVSRSGSLCTFTNCLSYTDFEQNPNDPMGSENVGHFVGWSGDSYVKMTNCYAYTNQAGLNNYGKATIVDMSQLKSGETAYRLAAGRTGSNTPWGQQLGTKNIPELLAHSAGASEVFYTSPSTRPATQEEWTTLFYPVNVTLPSSVEKFVVTSVRTVGGEVRVNELNSGDIAEVPLLLHSKTGFAAIKLPATYYNKKAQNNRLCGVYTETTAKSGDYVLDAANSSFVPASTSHSAWHCYIADGAGTKLAITDDQTPDFIIISSKADWNDFKAAYGGEKVTVYLDCDLTINEGETAMSKFSGTLYGQGHTITLNYTESAQKSAVFNKIEGTVENLRIVGSVPKGNNTLANETSGALTFKDCYSSVGFIGVAYHPVTFETCLSNVTTGQNWFVRAVEPGQGSVSNTTSYVGGANNGTNKYDAIEATTDQFKSGEVAYKLNNGRTGKDAAWLQTLGTDSYPVLKSASPESKEVYYAAGDNRSASTVNKWSSLYYPTDVTLPEGVMQFTEFAVVDSIVYVNATFDTVVPAYQPTLLYAENGMPGITLPSFYYNDISSEQDGDIRGTAERKSPDSSMRVLTGLSQASGTFGKASSNVSPYQCYLNLDEYDTYFIELDGVLIHSKDDWDLFREKYNGKPVTARLFTDLTLTEEDCMEHFVGTFYGMGQTITVNYLNVEGGDNVGYAPFKTAEGTIQTLSLKGTILSISGPCSSSPLVYKVADGKELNIKYCCNDVNFTLTDGSQTYDYVSNVGGYVNTVGSSTDDAAKLNIEDCSFTGTITTSLPLKNAGGYVANVVSEQAGAVSIKNSFCDLSGSSIASLTDANAVDYFAHGNSQAISITNSYTRPIYTTSNTTLANVGQATLATDEQLRNGEIAYKLQAAHADEEYEEIYWGQNIGTDPIPMNGVDYTGEVSEAKALRTALKVEADDDDEYENFELPKVYKTEAQSYEFDAEGWGTLFYPSAVQLPENVKAYTISTIEDQTHEGVTEKYVVLTEVEGNSVPAATPVILRVTPNADSTIPTADIQLGTVYYNLDDVLQTAELENDYILYGLLEDFEETYFCYVLRNDKDATAFYLEGDDVEDELPVVPAYHCLLLYTPDDLLSPDYEMPDKIKFSYLDPTAINNAVQTVVNADGKIYDLQGRQVQTLHKGNIYIKNGVKFYVK